MLKPWVCDIFTKHNNVGGVSTGVLYFHVFDQSKDKDWKIIQKLTIDNYLRFDSEEDAIEFSIILKKKYFDERDNLYRKIEEINYNYTKNREMDRIAFDRKKKLKELNASS